MSSVESGTTSKCSRNCSHFLIQPMFLTVQTVQQHRVRESSKLSLIGWCVNNMTLCHNTSTWIRQTRTGTLSIRGVWSCWSRGIIRFVLKYCYISYRSPCPCYLGFETVWKVILQHEKYYIIFIKSLFYFLIYYLVLSIFQYYPIKPLI